MSANPTVVPKSAVQRLNDWVDKEEIVLKLNDSLVCRLKDGASWTLGILLRCLFYPLQLTF